MPKSNAPMALNLSAARSTVDGLQPLSASTLSPNSPRSPGTPLSPRSIPGSPFMQQSSLGQTMSSNGVAASQRSRDSTIEGTVSATMTGVPQFPPSPSLQPQLRGRDLSKSFFSNLAASKSSHRLGSPECSGAEAAERLKSKSRASSKDRILHPLKGKSSRPELPKCTVVQQKPVESAAQQQGLDPSTQAVPEPINQPPNRRTRPRFAGLLGRTKSIRIDNGFAPKTSLLEPTNPEASMSPCPERDPQYETAMKTAPLHSDHRQRTFQDVNGSSIRNRSADRPVQQSQENLGYTSRKEKVNGSVHMSSSAKDSGGANLLSNIHHTGKGMGDRIGKAGKGIFGKITRSGSSNERELVTDDNYTCRVINLPLTKQTRMTRIARRLELSRDKTEFWMPALPWRCIDYLNMNGCEEEGLYRIPGSGKDVKHWQRRFDTEHDINLFDEPELYDINTIGSMFKSWLRELPDEIFPKVVQHKIADRCRGATSTPQLLKDELSMLPPFNYYLLFAITCHLSLLHSFADKNRMDYRNLCICFQPCLKIDGFCFQFLVQDWKNCWQGCWTEKEFLEEENRYEREGSIGTQEPTSSISDDRAISSSDSSQHAHTAPQNIPQDIPKIQHIPSSKNSSTLNVDGSGTHSTISVVDDDLKRHEGKHTRSDSRLPDLRPLSMLKM